jgi:hypothetical protein
MPLALDDLKARLGITDDSQDAAILAVAAQAQALCEAYCDRKFDYLADEEETFEAARAFLVRRWPIDPAVAVEIVDEQGRVVPSQNYRLNRAQGIIYGRSVSWAAGWAFGWSPLTVRYAGGLEPWPSDLTWAVTNAFDILWAETPGGGLPPGGAGSTGDIKKYSVVGAFSVESVAGAAGEVGANEGDGWGPLTASVTRGLDIWRRESRLGAG